MPKDTTTVLSVDLLPGEHWWGGAVADGQLMPFGSPTSHRRDLATNAGHADHPTAGANQSAPLLVSTEGRVIWSEKPFTLAIGDGCVSAETEQLTAPELRRAADRTLRGGYRLASAEYFPPSGDAPAREMFTGPQYSTWIELPYTPTQAGVLSYAKALLSAGFPPGVLMIDDRWSVDYGDWRFDAGLFPDPAAMVDELHSLGFSVMLWLVPFVSPDSPPFRDLRARGLLLEDSAGSVIVREWWNGFSALLDTTNPAAMAWLGHRLAELQDSFGVDGFKFDAGDLRDYRPDDKPAAGSGPVELCEAYARFGSGYPFNEFRACWKMGGTALAQRLHDKPPTWDDAGLLSLVPEGIAQGLMGHAFTCADMVGGGELSAFAPGTPVDQEQFVRYAQCAALFPMLQFSIAPARVLDEEHLAAVLGAVALRQEFLPLILDLVDHAARTGEPIIRALEYHFPGYSGVTDQFLLGDSVLVAPILEQGATSKRVVLPPGDWAATDGTVYPRGTHDLPAGLASFPVFRLVR